MDFSQVKLKKVDKSTIKDTSIPQPKKALEELEKNKKVQDTNVEKWEKDLRDEVIPSLFVPLSMKHALTLHKGYEVQVLKKGELSSEDQTHLKEIAQLIDVQQNNLKNKDQFFIRLSTRSPKDARVFSDINKKLIESEIEKWKQQHDQKEIDLNTKLGIVHRSIFKSLLVKDGSEAVQLLISSRRIWQDIEASLEFISREAEMANIQIVLREWADLDTALEFRLFVFERKLTAMCSYNRVCYWPEVNKRKSEIEKILRGYWENKLQSKISSHLSNFILDIALLPNDQPIVVELNNFNDFEGNKTDAELFDWTEDIDVLTGKKPFEFRTLDKPLTKEQIIPKVPMAVKILMGWESMNNWKPATDHW